MRRLLFCLLLPACSSELQSFVRPSLVVEGGDVVELGVATAGERMQIELTLHNPGELELGLGVPFFATERDPIAGHAGAFDVQLPCPATAIASDGREVCVLPPGQSAELVIGFRPVVEGHNWDALTLVTDDVRSWGTLSRQVLGDRTRDTHTLFVHGMGRDVGRLVTSPAATDFGWVWPGQLGEGQLDITVADAGEVSGQPIRTDPSRCDGGLTAVETTPWTQTVQVGAPRKVLLYFTAPSSDAWRCVLLIEDDQGRVIEHMVTANTGSPAAHGDGEFDRDGDGWTEAEGDCDDGANNIFPGRHETPDDGLDNDCDGRVDELGLRYDDDGDGYTEAEGDCDDRRYSVHPGADELCLTTADEDCDQQTIGDECVGVPVLPFLVGGALFPDHSAVEIGDELRFRGIMHAPHDPWFDGWLWFQKDDETDEPVQAVADALTQMYWQAPVVGVSAQFGELRTVIIDDNWRYDVLDGDKPPVEVDVRLVTSGWFTEPLAEVQVVE